MEKFELKESRTGLIHLVLNDGKAYCSGKVLAETNQSMHRGNLLKVHPRFFCKNCFGQVAQERLPKLIKQGKLITGETKNIVTKPFIDGMRNKITKKIAEIMTLLTDIVQYIDKK